MRETSEHDIEELSIRIDEKVRDKLYNIIKQIIAKTYTESMLVVLLSRLRVQGKIEKPQELVEYMIKEPIEFYNQVKEQFKGSESADAFLKTLFDEISRTIGIPPLGKEIVEALKEDNEEKVREKLLEITYIIRTKTLRTMY